MLCRLSVLRSQALLNELLPDDPDEEQEAFEARLVPVLTHLLKAASTLACNYTGRQLALTEYTDDAYSGDGSKQLWLRQYPVAEVDAIRVWDGNDWAVIDAGHYTIIEQRFVQYPARGVSLALYGAWPHDCEGDNIEVDYSAGYDNTGWDTADVDGEFGVPADLEHAVGALASLMFMDGRGDQGRLGMTSMSRSAETLEVERYEKGIPESVKLVLDGYKRRSA